MPEEEIDANSAAASSVAAPDANQQAAAPSTAEVEAPSTVAQAEEPTLAQVAQEAFDKASQAETEESGKPASDVQSLDKTEAKEEQPKSEAVTGQQQKEEQVPFHDHPRWKEVIQQKQEFETRVKEFEPLAKAQQNTNAFCQQYGVTVEQYQNAMHIMALLNTNPAEARKALEPIWKTLEPYDGNILPSDLQARVDADELKPDVAKEMADLRAKVNGQQATQKLSAHQQQQNAAAAVTNAVGSWDQARRVQDPDFRPVGEGQQEGLYENVNQRLISLWVQNPPNSVQAATALCEKAYSQAKTFFSARLAKPAPSRVLSSQRSSQTPRQKDPSEADSTHDLVNQTTQEIARQHGINWTPGA